MPGSSLDALIAVIREVIDKRQITQEELSALCGEHVSFVPKIVTGRRDVTLEDMEKLAKGSGLTELELYARMWAVRDSKRGGSAGES